MINIIMAIILYPGMIFMYFVIMRMQKKTDRGVAFGATLKPEWLEDGDMEEITKAYEKESKRNLVVLAIIPWISLLIPYISIQLTIWIMWSLALLFVLYVPFGKANKKVKRLKMEKGWKSKISDETFVELKTVRRVKLISFLIPTLIGVLIPFGLEFFIRQSSYGIEAVERIEALSICVWVIAMTGVVLFLLAIWMDHQKTEVISSDSTININYTRAKKNVWKNFWMAAIWLNTIYTFVLSGALMTDWFVVFVLVGAMVEVILLTVLCYIAIKKVYSIDKKYSARQETAFVSDEDERWILGMFYFNQKDRHVIVNDRVGTGTTVNLATPAGKGLSVFSVLVILSIPVMCIWLIMLEFTPINLSVDNHCLVGKHLDVDYEIPVEEIENLVVVNEKPEWTKSVGTAMENLDKGSFYIRNVGKCEVFLNPENTVFLRFEADGKVYYMGGYDDAQTMKVYEELTAQ